MNFQEGEEEEMKLGGGHMERILLEIRKMDCGYDYISLYICIKFSRNLF